MALTGRTSPEDLQRIVASGFDEYLAKPFSFDRLDSLLSSRFAEGNGPVPRLRELTEGISPIGFRQEFHRELTAVVKLPDPASERPGGPG